MSDDRETHRHAITAFAWAVIGLIWLPLLGPIVSMIYAGKARRAVAANPVDYKGRELSESASSIATFALMLQILLIAVLVTVVVVALTTKAELGTL